MEIAHPEKLWRLQRALYDAALGSAASKVAAPHRGAGFLSADLSPVEIPATGGRQGFAREVSMEIAHPEKLWRLQRALYDAALGSAASKVAAPHRGAGFLSADLSPVEIPATGGRQGFARGVSMEIAHPEKLWRLQRTLYEMALRALGECALRGTGVVWGCGGI